MWIVICTEDGNRKHEIRRVNLKFGDYFTTSKKQY